LPVINITIEGSLRIRYSALTSHDLRRVWTGRTHRSV